MNVLVSLLIVAAAGAIAWGLLQVAQALRHAGSQARAARQLEILSLFAPGVSGAAEDPKVLLAWQPLAATARTLFPDDFATIERAAGSAFPFSAAQIEQAHSRWTADWLAWEHHHDVTYKLKAAQAEAALATSPVGRAELDAVEREKLERYQTRYSEYVKVAKALQALMTPRT